MEQALYDDFVARATEWLDANAERKPIASEKFVWGQGDDNIRLMGSEHPEDEEAALAAAAAWRAKAFDAGLAWAGRPHRVRRRRARPRAERRVAASSSRSTSIPDQGAWSVAWDMVGPAIAVHGSDDLKRRFLGPIYRGELLCSQLLSEPEAGSDLAGLKTRAVARRRRVGRQRPEGVELLRPPGPDRPADGPHRPGRAQAPGADDVPPAARLAGRGDPPAQADERRRPSSTRCSSPTCACPTPTASASRAAGGGRC